MYLIEQQDCSTWEYNGWAVGFVETEQEAIDWIKWKKSQRGFKGRRWTFEYQEIDMLKVPEEVSQ